ncbi:MAG: hemerythrin domain-containing protein [Bacteroidota bacterium]|nr:hemerythrin domain-containing protein [Bacteroidota bacterium]
MYLKNDIYIQPGMKVSEIILSNPYFMMMLEHFGIGLVVHEKTVEQICRENNIRIELFLTFANLFNGHTSGISNVEYSFNDIKTIIEFLKSSHRYYMEEKFPTIRSNIQQMFELNDQSEILMAGSFFNEYYNEVRDHLDYENKVVFPYVLNLYNQLGQKIPDEDSNGYSAAEYREHHDNIEEKLTDLKNLLIKYLPLKQDQKIRRKLLFSLFELEYDLHIHSQIEDSILIPLVEQMENHIKQRY